MAELRWTVNAEATDRAMDIRPPQVLDVWMARLSSAIDAMDSFIRFLDTRSSTRTIFWMGVSIFYL